MIYFNWKVLADWRTSSGLTQQQLAERAGVSKSMIEKIEAGAAPSTLKLGMIAQALEIPTSQLVAHAEVCDDLIEAALARYGEPHSTSRWETGIASFIGADNLIEARDELREGSLSLATTLTSLECQEEGGDSLVPSWGGAHRWVSTRRAEILEALDVAIGD